MNRPDPDEVKMYADNQWPQFSGRLNESGVIGHNELVLADLRFVDLNIVGEHASNWVFAGGMYLCHTQVEVVERLTPGDGTPIPLGLEAFFTGLQSLDKIERPHEPCFCDIRGVRICANGRAEIQFLPETTFHICDTLPPEIEELEVIEGTCPTAIQRLLEGEGTEVQAF